MSSRLSEIIEQLQSLPASELNEVRKALEQTTAQAQSDASASLAEDAFERQMNSKGFLRRVPKPVTDFSVYDNYQPVTAQGQPLSEMIIEERR